MMAVKDVDVTIINKYFIDRIDNENQLAYLSNDEGVVQRVSLQVLPKGIKVNDILKFSHNQYFIDNNQAFIKEKIKKQTENILTTIQKPYQTK